MLGAKARVRGVFYPIGFLLGFVADEATTKLVCGRTS